MFSKMRAFVNIWRFFFVWKLFKTGYFSYSQNCASLPQRTDSAFYLILMILTMCFTYHKADFLTLNWYSQLKRKIALIKQNADCLVKLLNWLFLFLHVKKFQTIFFYYWCRLFFINYCTHVFKNYFLTTSVCVRSTIQSVLRTSTSIKKEQKINNWSAYSHELIWLGRKVVRKVLQKL